MTQGPPKGHIETAVSRYSSLFTLPTYKSIIVYSCILCVVAGIMTVLLLEISAGLVVGLSLGASLFILTLSGDYLTANILLREDPILGLRRCSFLSLLSNLILAVSTFVATLMPAPSSDLSLWSKITSLGIFAALSLRFLVFCSISFAHWWKILLSALLQPALFLVPLSIILSPTFGFRSFYFSYFSLAVFFAFLGVYLFIASFNSVGIKELGVSPVEAFRAFVANWTEDLKEPIEEILERFSEEQEVKVSLLAFKAGKKMKAIIVVPNIHPGPFKNIGSSSIPSLIQNALEKKLGCVVSVPHGISGHELDLASQTQSKKVLNQILEASEFTAFHRYATPFLSLKKSDATVGCQIFGDCALLTLTLAPETMEDLPLELNETILREARERGIAWAVPIDAHNSVQGPFDPYSAVAPMKEAVTTVLEKAARHEQLPFEVGAAKVIPREFGVKEGMGPGGISVIVTKVGDRKAAYVTIDGNNMVSGLRDKILSSFKELGVNGEILTTDTHVVNGVVIADQGYYPVGEMIDHSVLIRYIKTAVTEALRNLEPATASSRQKEIHRVKVIGERQVNSLCLLVVRCAKKAKKSAALIFPSLSVLLTLLLIVL